MRFASTVESRIRWRISELPAYVKKHNGQRKGNTPQAHTILRHAESGAKKSSLTSQRPDGPPMADPTPSIRMAPPDGAGNPIPERFLLGLAPKKSAPLAPARAKEPPQPTARKGRLWVSIAGR